MSSVETRQMFAIGTGQMSAAKTGQMSAVQTRQMSSVEIGQSPVSIVPESSMTFASELFDARLHEERSCFLEALCCILLMTPCDFERFCLQHASKECMQNSSNVRKWSQNGPKTSPKSILGGLWRPLWSHP